ncbi:MAG: cation diffusion facilitator family transporter [Myxococcota bacterium]|nr:cation diffusion facilitator family transporter [Myxococcota bacterium]
MGHAHAHGHAHGHSHDHAHSHGGHAHDHGQSAPRRALLGALVLTASFMFVEVAVGLWSGSLALLADAGHMLNDAAALGLSLFVTWIAARPRTTKHTFGYRRAEVMGAFVNAVALGVAGVLIVVEGVERIGAPTEVRGIGMLLTAALGLMVNLGSAWILTRHGGDSINVKAALFHVLSDALGSMAAVIAGGLILGFGWTIADPIASLLIAVFILAGAWRLLKDTAHVLMEGAPRGVDVEDLEATILGTEGVDEVHDLHVWSLVPGEVLLSAHVILRPGAHGTDVARLVGVRLGLHGVQHATIQPEAPGPGLVELRRK